MLSNSDTNQKGQRIPSFRRGFRSSDLRINFVGIPAFSAEFRSRSFGHPDAPLPPDFGIPTQTREFRGSRWHPDAPLQIYELSRYKVSRTVHGHGDLRTTTRPAPSIVVLSLSVQHLVILFLLFRSSDYSGA